METKYIKVPFDLNLAKLITEKIAEGNIITRAGQEARILCFNRHTIGAPILALVDEEGYEEMHTYSLNGRYSVEYTDDLDLMLEIPEYYTFKEGDILKGIIRPFIFNGLYSERYDMMGTFCGIDGTGKLRIIGDGYLNKDECNWTLTEKVTYATQKDKELLISKLKESKNVKAKEYLTKYLNVDLNSIEEYRFSFKEWVLCKLHESNPWELGQFTFKDNNNFYHTVGGNLYKIAIPYKNNKNLLGKI